jgi:predicted HicB family RNase H-like nuclease
MAKDEENERRTSLRLPIEIHSQIVRECEKRPGNVSVNTWILEAITERLEADAKKTKSE